MDKFQGTIEEFKNIVNSFKLNGTWADTSQGLRYNSSDGGIIIWYESTGSILCQGKEKAKNNLKSLFDNYSPEKQFKSNATSINSEVTKKIFLVHGHDTTSREQLELILHKLGLDHFVLANTSGGGLTIIEALEKEISKDGDSKFGIVLLTPDDYGYSVKDGAENAKLRARQNVVLEMGMLIAAVGRENTVMLVKNTLELPSDASGILYLSYKNHVKEVLPRLVDRLNICGFNIDVKKMTNAAS
jgi:predicted nucleotide-binding protein